MFASTGKLMSSIMIDIEKIQVAVSHILADLLRQTFTAAGLLYVLLHTDWKLSLAALTVLPIVLIPTVRIGRRIGGNEIDHGSFPHRGRHL